MEIAQVTGAIWVDDSSGRPKELAAGVALYPYTILTAAHIKNINRERVKFKLSYRSAFHGVIVLRNTGRSIQYTLV